MSIGPVHIQLMLQNSTDVHKFGIEAAKPELHQQAVAEHAQKEIAREAHMVVKSTKSEQGSIHERDQSDSSGYHAKKRKSKNKNKKDDEQKSKKTNLFDVSV